MENKVNKVNLLQVEVTIHQVAHRMTHLMNQAVKDQKEEEKNQEMSLKIKSNRKIAKNKEKKVKS